MASKYEKGKLIESLDELVQQPRVWIGATICTRKTFIEWGIKYALAHMEMQQVHYAIRIKEKEKDNG